MRKAVLQQHEGYTTVTLKRDAGRKRTRWERIWPSKDMLHARALIVKHEWEQNADPRGIFTNKPLQSSL